MGDGTITRVRVKSFRVTRFAIRTTTVSCKILLLDVSALDGDRRSIVAGVVRMETGSKCHGTYFRFSRNIPRMRTSIKSVHGSMSTAEFSTISNQTSTCRLPIRTKGERVSSSVGGCLIALCSFAAGWLFNLCFKLPFIRLLLMLLSSAHVSRRQVFAGSWLEQSPT